MIYLSAQPDDVYFLWQLQLQLYNFHLQGIKNEDIHILISYNIDRGLNLLFKKFIDDNPTVNVYTYPDTRKTKKYLSSIRPHLISKHLKKYPQLEHETIFYHDSDILFSSKVDWSALLNDDVWYVSDARSYLDSNYIINCIGNNGFKSMCKIVGIPCNIVELSNQNAGGAQYILKNTSVTFWKKIERDCESLYSYLYHQQKMIYHKNESWQKFQIWCTDMWVLWWNALLEEKTFKISPLLDFCITSSPLYSLEKKKILHYTGNCRDKKYVVFDKTKYQTHSPFYEDLECNYSNCSAYVVDMIESYKKQLNSTRYVISDILFVYTIDNTFSEIEKAKINYFTKYLLKYLKVPIIFGTTEEISKALEQRKEKIVLYMPFMVIIPINEIINIINRSSFVLYKETCFVYSLLQIDPLLAHIFFKVLDIDFLEENQGKMRSIKGTSTIKIYNRKNAVDKCLTIDRTNIIAYIIR